MKLPIIPIVRASYNSKLSFKKGTNINFFRSVYMVNDTGEITQSDLNRVTESSIRERLKEHSVAFMDGYTCLYIQGCGLCHKTTKKLAKATKTDSTGIYINKKTGFFLCDKCCTTGNWSNFSEFLKKVKAGSAKNKEALLIEQDVTKHDQDISAWINIVENSTLVYKLDNNDFKNIFVNFQLTPCSKAITEKLQMRISNDKNILYLPLFSFGSCVVGYKSIDINNNINTFPNNDCSGFLMTHTEKKTAVITAQLPDFFALVSQNLSMEVLCFPHGISNLPQSTLPFLERYNKLILWLGGADVLDATGNFAKKLNEKRCMVVKPTKNQTSALAAVSKGENIPEILTSAKSAWHESIISFHSLREEVLSELQNKDQCAGVTWKRFPALNKILKGHRRGELTVLTGPTGSGKTTFISEYSLDLAMQGVNTLWGSFEIKNARLAKKMLQQFSRIPMEENLDKFDYWADKFEQLPIFFMTFHGQQSLTTVMDAVEHCSYVHDIAHVIIDNVQFMIDVSPDSISMDRFWRQDVLIQSFRSFASKNNCHVTLVMHPKKGMDGMDLSVNSIFGGAKAAQEADNILIIQNKASSSFLAKKMLQVSTIILFVCFLHTWRFCKKK